MPNNYIKVSFPLVRAFDGAPDALPVPEHRYDCSRTVNEVIPFDDGNLADCDRAAVELSHLRTRLRVTGTPFRVSVYRTGRFDLSPIGGAAAC